MLVVVFLIGHYVFVGVVLMKFGSFLLFFELNYGMYTQVLVYVYVGEIYVYTRLCYYSIIILLLNLFVRIKYF